MGIKAKKQEYTEKVHQKIDEHTEKRKDPDYPRISLKSMLYVMKIYRKAVGPKRFFVAFYRLYNAVLPSVTAVLAGAAVTAIANAAVSHDLIPFIVLIAVLLGVQLINLVLSMINNYLSLTTFHDVSVYLSEQVATKYIQIPLKMRETKEFADKFNRVRDFSNSVEPVSTSVISVVSAIIGLISVVVATLMVSPILTAVVILSSIPSSVLTLKLAAKRRRNWRKFTSERRMAWRIEEKIIDSNNALGIELNGLSNYLVKRMIKASRRAQEQDITDEKSFLWPKFGTNLLETITEYGVLVTVALAIIYGILEIGQFFTVRALLSQLSSNVANLFNSISYISEGLVNATDYMEFMEIPARPKGNTVITEIPKIEFRNVSFSYPNTCEKALDGVSFVLEPGDSLAVVGENGAGKTTLVKLLVGAYEPSDGTILVNDQPLAQIDRDSYLMQLGALFQDYPKYEFATLGENVWFGNTSRDYKPAEVERALALADLEGFSSRFGKGLNQILSKDFDEEVTADLSGGQWQRLAIARIMYRSPNILLLDEPTSAIDAKSEYKIFKNILEAQKGKTTLIISHRFSAVRKAKKILVLDHGKVIESGSHEELISKKGVYKTLFDVQAEGYK